MRYAVLAICLALACQTVPPAQAQVHVNIGINLPAPPQWALVPNLPVYYAPGAPADVFQYNGQCYAFVSGGWYEGPSYDGPWISVAAQFVPAPLLRIPVRYYHEPPGHWRDWRHEDPPRWEHDYGHEWGKHREGWRGKKRGREDDDND